MNKLGFSLVEVTISVLLLIIIFSFSFFEIRNLQTEAGLNLAKEELINILHLARSNAVSSKNNSNWGVKINIEANNTLILYQGESYETRDISQDRPIKLENMVDCFSDSLSDINFRRLSGDIDQSVNLTLRYLNTEIFQTIRINQKGKIESDA